MLICLREKSRKLQFQCLNVEKDDVFTVDGVEMGRRVVAKEKFDDDPIKSGYFWHRSDLVLCPNMVTVGTAVTLQIRHYQQNRRK